MGVLQYSSSAQVDFKMNNLKMIDFELPPFNAWVPLTITHTIFTDFALLKNIFKRFHFALREDNFNGH